MFLNTLFMNNNSNEISVGLNWSFIYEKFPFKQCYTVLTFNSCTSRPDACQCLVVQRSMSNIKPSTSMTHIACESRLRSVLKTSMHPCSGNLVAIGRAVYFARVAHAFSAVIKCRHCRCLVCRTFWSPCRTSNATD